MENRLIVFGLLISLAFSSVELRASEWKEIINLKGTWSFTVGDDINWANPETNISDWDQVRVPGLWERYYDGYNGFGWYRKNFDANLQSAPDVLVLFLGHVDDVDEVFLNGEKIGQSGKFPPNQSTAYEVERRYVFPKSLLKPTNNVIAVRVYDERREGGIISGDKIGIYYDTVETMLLFDLGGTWKFTTQSYRNIHAPEFDDSRLDDIFVPSVWESQGYEGYDGYAWYRKHFSLPDNFPNKNLFLVLGQIDEIDKVYLNGNLIGQTKYLDEYKKININDAFLLYRSYKIPDGTLKKQNIITIEVLDKYGDGGIYSGPVGIMNEENRNRFMENHKIEKRKKWFQIILDYFNEN